MPVFDYKGWKLEDALDALCAYDQGSTDSGVKDEDMRRAVKEYLNGLSYRDRSLALARHVRDYYLSTDRLRQGYGLADVASFLRWLDDYMGIYM